jgi:hypothetical protein
MYESMKIFNFEKEDEITSEIVSERYFDYVQRNSQEKGGSAYITAKIENAKDAIVSHYGLHIIEPEAEAEEGEGEESEQGETQVDENG